MEKIVVIDGREVKLRASALIPRLYRARFGRDMISDMRRLERKYNAVMADEGLTEDERQEEGFTALDLTVFENLAYCMALNGGEHVPPTPDEWLDGFETFSIYEILPAMMDLWGNSNKTTAEPKKKLD